MVDRANLISALRATNRQHWFDSAKWLGWAVLGGLLPLWGGWFLLLLFKHRERWPELISHGELAIYSAAFLASAVYVIQRDVANISFVHREVFNLLAVIGLLISAILFTGVTIVATTRAPVAEGATATFLTLDQEAMLWISGSLFSLSIVLAFLVTVIDNSRTDPDVRRIANQAQEKLESQFTRTGEGT